jgi:hypothetical protein
MSDSSSSAASAGIGFGSAMAMVLSFQLNHSIWWMILHGICSGGLCDLSSVAGELLADG